MSQLYINIYLWVLRKNIPLYLGPYLLIDFQVHSCMEVNLQMLICKLQFYCNSVFTKRRSHKHKIDRKLLISPQFLYNKKEIIFTLLLR